MSTLKYKEIEDPILNKYYTTPLCKKYIEFDGFTVQERFLDIYEQLRDFEVYDDDVWLNTYPRSGTTFSQEMIWQIGNKLDFEGGKEKLNSRFPNLSLLMYDYRGCLESGNYKDIPVGDILTDPLNVLRNAKRPRYIKLHLPLKFFPKQILTGERKPKVIYVSRNPKDTCISFHHVLKTEINLQATLEEHCKLFMEGKILYGPHWLHVAEAWKHRKEENFLIITYEEIHKDLKAMIYKVAKFLNKSLTEAQVEQLKEHLRFDNFQKNSSINRNVEGHQLEIALGIYRLGKVEADELSPELAKKFEQWEKDIILSDTL